ncbi:hypothetical protein TNCV_4605461 [Trichonephila clavipes]|nr:hypothetical protein TNCV_4605461 [Trichonephila clavipes]
MVDARNLGVSFFCSSKIGCVQFLFSTSSPRNPRAGLFVLSNKSTEKAVYGTEKFKRDTLVGALDKLIFDLNRSQVYAEYSKKLKFLMDLQDQIIYKNGYTGSNLTQNHSRSQSEIQGDLHKGTGEYFPPLQSHGKIVEVEIGGVAIYRPFGEFRQANSYCHLRRYRCYPVIFHLCSIGERFGDLAGQGNTLILNEECWAIQQEAWRVVGRLEGGKTRAEVVQAIGVSQSVISRIWNRFLETGSAGR